jgi:2-keto-4-pentenoate hydratase/2-oxohepta-3-ene-1,7-dioic acid hydratase in catechol pathway
VKIVSFKVSNELRYGLVSGEGVIDLTARLAPNYPTINRLLDGGLGAAEKFVNQAADFSLKGLEFAPVVPWPEKIVCAAVNYDDHRIEAGRDRSENPVVFLRLARAQVGHQQPMVVPAVSHHFDYEGEIAVVIGKTGRHISKQRAMDHVAGYALYNDGSVRDWQRHSSQFTAGKNWEGTGAFGPWLVTRDEIADYRTTQLATRLNGRELQKTSADLMIFSIEHLIAYISTFITLVPGDVIATGTAGGVGFKRTPPIFLTPGDICEVEASGIGLLSNVVKAETSV